MPRIPGEQASDGRTAQASSPQPRHPFRTGPRPLASLLPPITRPAFRKRSPATATLMTDWIDIVGPALGATTRPHRLQGGTLTLGCPGPVALELQHLERALLERINLRLGSAAVQRLRFVHETVAPPARVRPNHAASRPVPVPGVGDLLAGALGRLGAAIASRSSPPEPSGDA